MQLALPHPLLSRLSELLEAQIGLHFPKERWRDLERGIAAAAREFGFPEVEACARRLLSAPLTHRQIEILASHLTVGETSFFRDRKSFEALEQYVLPALIRSRRDSERRLRIWSAGCSTGEEPYSIAVVLDRLLPDHEQWQITLLATDINPQSLRKAMEGAYGAWSFRDTPDWIRERYFKKVRPGRFEVHPRIRKIVTFSYLNFAEDIYPSLANNTSAMDVIFCRNVLMYFTAQRAKQVVANFHRALVDGGWLIVSPTEASNTLLSSFTPVEFPGAFLYRKLANAGEAASIAGEASAWKPKYIAAEAAPTGAGTIDFRTGARPEVSPADRSLLNKNWNIPLPDAAILPATQTVQQAAPQPDELATPSRMARSCANQGRLGEALEWCEKAIAADKMNPAHHYLLATILQEQGQHEIAIQSLIRALYLKPMFVLAHFALGNLHQSQGRYREAQRYFANVLLLLRKRPQDEILPEADGLTAGRLAEIVTSLLASLPQAVEARA